MTIPRQMKACSLALALSVGVFEAALAEGSLDNRVQDLERRVQGIENNTQEILRLLRQGGGAGPAGVATQQAAETQLRAGMTLGVCPLRPSREGRLPQECNGIPAASALVSLPNEFSFEQALRNSELAPMTRVSGDGMIGLQWSAMIRITEAGRHTFQANVNFTGNTAGAVNGGCRTVVTLNDKVVAHAAGNFTWMSSTARSYTDQGFENLAPGLYSLRVFLACVFDSHHEHHLRQVGATVMFAEPNDSSLKRLPSDRIGVRS